MIAGIIRGALHAGVCAGVIFPVVAWGALPEPASLARQPAFSALIAADGAAQEEMVARIMVKPRYRAGDALNDALRARDAGRLSNLSRVAMSVVRPMSGGAHVVRLDRPVTLSEARVIAARLMRDDSVELAEPDRLKRHFAVTPTDPGYAANQWNLQSLSSQNRGSANLPNAWSITQGSGAVTVAVIDSGYRAHADLGAALLPGYDFIADALIANDGDGRDADAQDPGNWITGAENINPNSVFYGCGAVNFRGRPINQLTPSSWHGTHVAGVIAARMNNGIGTAGVAPNIQILPVRVLGKCGGYDSDVIDGMRWAAGITAGLPPNPNPAQVLNMSLGGSDGLPCSQAYQSAVTEIVAAGKVIVVATGNDGSATLSSPANCSGVIAVTANTIDGDNAWYATIGPGTTLSAPGGGCGGTGYPNNCAAANSAGVYSLWNNGLTVPGGDGYTAYSGTSMAAPHVAGVVALMLSLNPALTPAQIKSYLQSSARPHPPGTICTFSSFSGMCGAGLLDAHQALNAVQPATTPPPVVTLGVIPSAVTQGDSVTLSGSAAASGGRSIASYAWTQQSGPAVALANANSATASFTASSPGVYTFVLTATDSAGQSGAASATITVSAPAPIPPPVVTLGAIPAVVAPGEGVTLSGSATASGGRSIASYAWTQQSGPSTVVLMNANSATASFTASSPGAYTFMLTATDSAGQSGAASAVIVVIPPVPASPPVVTLDAIPAVVAPGALVALSGSAAAGEGASIVSYAWSQQTGSAVVIGNANSAHAYFIAPPTGTYSFTLTATDDDGQTGAASVVIHVNSPPVLHPVAAQTVAVGQTLGFAVTASDADGDTLLFHPVSLPPGATLGATGNFSWPNAAPAGSYTLVYYASDPYDANSAQGVVNITVGASPGVSAGGGGGGGSLSAELLFALALLAAGLRLRRRPNP